MIKFLKTILAFLRSCLLQFALTLRAKMRRASLEEAIKKADAMKQKTGAKVLVVFDGNDYNTIKKRSLKKLSKLQKGKPGRIVNGEVIKSIEKRAPYVAN